MKCCDYSSKSITHYNTLYVIVWYIDSGLTLTVDY